MSYQCLVEGCPGGHVSKHELCAPSAKTVTVLTAAKITELTTKFPAGLGEDTFVHERDYNQAENGRVARADQIERLQKELYAAQGSPAALRLEKHGAIRPVETTPAHCIDCIELKNALAAAVKVANEARECHDRDQDMRTMKLLIALSGHLPKWRADTDRIHDVLRRAVERLSAPMPPEEPEARREYHANVTYWSGVPTIDMPCDFCTRPITDHDPRTHACPPEKTSAKVVPSVCGKPMPNGKGAGQCINVPGHEGECDDMPL